MSTFIPCMNGNNCFADTEVKLFGDLISIGEVMYTKEAAEALARAVLALASQKSERTRPMTPTHVCPRCTGAAGRYDFNAPDGVLITTWHCHKCKRDVVPKLATA